MDEQLSFFAAMDAYEAVELTPEQCLENVTAWTIEHRGIRNSVMEGAPVLYYEARPRKIMFERDSYKDQYGWNVSWKAIDGKSYWCASWVFKKHWLFATKPGAADCRRHVREFCREYKGQEIREWT